MIQSFLVKIYNNKLFNQFAGFSIVGVIVTLFSLVLLYVFLNFFKLNVYLSYIIVYLISIGLSYVLNGRLVFKSEMAIKTYVLYYLIYISGMLIGVFIINVAEAITAFSSFINSIVATPFTMIWNFILVKQLFSKPIMVRKPIE